jgi:delta1-piperideine-2-carboxylate reductase
MINCERAVVPHGAASAVYGTNPIAFAAPRADAAPLVFDFATAAAASGEVAMARLKGADVPPGTGVDAEGFPTTDPARIIDGGALLAFGGHKGSSIAMMIEILCAALVDCRFSFEVPPAGKTGVRIPQTGQTIIVIDPEAGGADREDRALARRVDQLVAELRGAGQDRIPGDRRSAARLRARERGIALSQLQFATLDELASP